MAEQYCPECGCEIADDAFEQEGIVYCCEPCATSSECECGCEDDEDEES